MSVPCILPLPFPPIDDALRSNDVDEARRHLEERPLSQHELNTRLAHCIKRAGHYEAMIELLIEHGAEPLSLIPPSTEELQFALQQSSRALALWALEAGKIRAELTEEEWKFLLAACLEMRGLEGLSAIKDGHKVPPEALYHGLTIAVEKNQPKLVKALLKRGAEADEAIWYEALEKNCTHALVELYAACSPPSSFSLANWQQLIEALVLHRAKRSAERPLNQKALDSLLLKYLKASKVEEIDQLIGLGADVNRDLLFCLKEPALLHAAVRLLVNGADFRRVSLELWKNFLLRLVSEVFLEDLLALRLNFDFECLSELFYENCGQAGLNATLSKLVALGAQFEDEEFTALIESIEHDRDSESLKRLIHAVPRLSHETARKLLECYLVRHHISYRIFSIQKFPAEIVEESLFYHARLGNVLFVEKLILHGVDIDAEDREGKNALVHAVASGHLAVANLLLGAGAEPAQALPIARAKGSRFAAFCNTVKKQAARLSKLQQDPLLSERLDVRALRELAIFFFQKFPQIQKKAFHHEKRDLYARSYSLFYCNRGSRPGTIHAIYILMKSGGSLNARESFKKASDALLIPVTAKGAIKRARDMVQVITGKDLTSSQIEAARAEMYLQASLGDVEGVWHLTDVREYFDHGIERITSFSPRATNLSQLWVRLNIFQKLAAMKQLARGLESLHQREIFHGDIKETNCLARILPNREIEASWNDLGFSFCPASEPINDIMSWGFYGRLEATAPELLGENNFRGNFFLLEVYALGCMFYTLYFGKSLPWDKFLRTCYRELKGNAASIEERRHLKRAVHDFVELPLERLSKEPEAALSPRDFAKKLFLQMMRPNASERISLAACSRGLDELEQKHRLST